MNTVFWCTVSLLCWNQSFPELGIDNPIPLNQMFFLQSRLINIALVLFWVMWSMTCSVLLILSCVCLFCMKPLWSLSINSGIMFSILLAIIDAYSLEFVLRIAIGLYKLHSLSLPYLGITDMMASLYDGGRPPSCRVQLKQALSRGVSCSLKVLNHSEGKPSGP
jgi:hypothetical protein